MTASVRDFWSGRRVALCAFGLSLCVGCGTSGVGTPVASPIEPLPRLGTYVPDAADKDAHALAAAALVGDELLLRERIAHLKALEEDRAQRGEAPTGLLPYALDARHATASDPRARRLASRRLLERGDLDPALRARLEEEVADDPLGLAGERLHDARVRRFGRVANALVEPVGRSATNTLLLPLRLLQSLLGLAVEQHQADELGAAERQALAHWKQFVEQHPEAPEAALLLEEIEQAQLRWFRTQRDRHLRRARKALDKSDPVLAAALAERALRYAPEDPAATRLLAKATRRGDHFQQELRRSVSAPAQASPGFGDGRALAVALLASQGPIEEAAAALLAEAPRGPLADEARFALATARFEAGFEAEAWGQLEDLADRSDARSNMARHARALVHSPEQNPYRAFRVTRRQVTGGKLRWLFFGPLASGARDRDLPRPVEWLLELPAVAGTAIGFGNRLIRYPFFPADHVVPSVLARRYLERRPDGDRAEPVRQWLEDFEAGRGNHVGALRLAQGAAPSDPGHIERLRGRAAEQALEASRKERRRDVRLRLLRQVAQQFQGTSAAQEAGELVREEALDGAPQHIRVSRGFLLEHPSVAGPEALALRPSLLDGDPSNGELHPEGITLLGGRVIEFAFVDESGRERRPPTRSRRTVSQERLARVVAQLEETALHTLRVDPDARVDHDADRDRYFERARLGLTDRVDLRAHAESTYEFLGMRERYGLVRSRESILPVAIVLQGSFEDLGLGAFPRIRMPKPTADAFLYR